MVRGESRWDGGSGQRAVSGQHVWSLEACHQMGIDRLSSLHALLVATGCYWLLLVAATGCYYWLLLVASGCFWLLLVASGCQCGRH